MQPSGDAGSLQLVLGESLSIEPTITRHLSRQAGRNVVIVGSDQELAANLIGTIARGWTIGNDTTIPETIFFDGSRTEDIKIAELRKLLGEVKRDDNSPAVQVVDPRGVDAAVAMLHDELTKRLENPNESYPTRVLVVANLGRFRELRRNEEFSFGTKASEQIATDEAFSKLLREGPNVGIFTLCWVDSWGTLSRFVPRQGLRDLEIRILMQMSANDSNQLIDSSAANKLESHALIYYDETDGKIVKVRPYRL